MFVTPPLATASERLLGTSGGVSYWNVVWYTALTGWVVLVYALWIGWVAMKTVAILAFTTRVFTLLLLFLAAMSFLALPAVASQNNFLDAGQTLLDFFTTIWNTIFAEPVNQALFCFRWFPIWLNDTIDFLETMVAIIANDGFGIDLFDWALRVSEEGRERQMRRDVLYAWGLADAHFADRDGTGPLGARARSFVRRAEAAGLVGERLTIGQIMDFLCQVGGEIMDWVSDLFAIFADFVLTILSYVILAIEDLGSGNVEFVVVIAQVLVEKLLDVIDPLGCYHPLDNLPQSIFPCLCPWVYSSIDDVPNDVALAVLGCVCGKVLDLSVSSFEDVITLFEECIDIPFLTNLLDTIITLINFAESLISYLQAIVSAIFGFIDTLNSIIDEINGIASSIQDFIDSLSSIFSFFRYVPHRGAQRPTSGLTSMQTFSNQTFADPHAFEHMLAAVVPLDPSVLRRAAERVAAKAPKARQRAPTARERLTEFYATGRPTVVADAIATKMLGGLVRTLGTEDGLEEAIATVAARCDQSCVDDAATVLGAARDVVNAYVASVRAIRFDAHGQVIKRTREERMVTMRKALPFSMTEVRGAMRRMGASVRARMAPEQAARIQRAEGAVATAFFGLMTVLAPKSSPALADRLARRGEHVRQALDGGMVWLEDHLSTFERARGARTNATVTPARAREIAARWAPAAMRSDTDWLRSGAASSRLLRDFYQVDDAHAEGRFLVVVIGLAVVGTGALALTLTFLTVVGASLLPLLVAVFVFIAPILMLVIFPIFSQVAVNGVITWMQNGKPGGVDFFTPILALIADGVYESFVTGWASFDFLGFVADLGDLGEAYAQYVLIEYVRQVLMFFSFASPPHCGWDRITGIPNESFIEWIDHILECNPNDVCTTPLDYPGEAPCLCSINPSDSNEWRTRYGTESKPCVDGSNTPIGHRLCWPRQNTGFNIPELDLSAVFDLRCYDLGYDITGITTYQEPRVIVMVWNWVRNGYAGLKEITRAASVGRLLPWIGLLGAAFGIIPVVGRLGKHVAKITLYWNVFSYASSYVGTHAIAFLGGSTVPSWLQSWSAELLSFFRYPNYDALNPKGSAELRDPVCLVLHSPLIVLSVSIVYAVAQVAVATFFAGGVLLTIGIFIDLVLRAFFVAYMFMQDIIYSAILYTRGRSAQYTGMLAPGVDLPERRFAFIAERFGHEAAPILHVTQRMREQGEEVPADLAEAEVYAQHAQARTHGTIHRYAGTGRMDGNTTR
ncbi:MAG TPA: hypothetical protein VKD22_16190 [Ramlibacter sp.]|nr:hypothetical protein [Ramlibacter sp.]